MTAFVVVNPKAANGHTGRDWPKIKPALESVFPLMQVVQSRARGETARLVRAALKDLPEEQLAMLKLAFYEGLSHREIADRLDVPLGTVKSRIRLAFLKMKAKLDNE